ncbi:MAG TPA: hypothetical protein VHZ55_26705 [Bryobacteraceae bacterium]|jgi:hypothetical protein|nr:hypothetical protein [Bryobacteraceae bacterium]
MNFTYTLLLKLYPSAHRRVFEAEMLEVMQRAERERSVFAEWAGLLPGAALAWLKRAPEELEGTTAEQRVQMHIRAMEYAIAHHQFAKARHHSDEERKARRELRQLSDNN